MKLISFVASLLVALATPLIAGNLVEANLINVQGERIKLVENTMSPDGRYAGGWTVAPKKGKPAVDWKRYGGDDSTFLDDYLDNEGYVVTDVIVDLTHKSITSRLQFKEPYYDHKGHGALEIVYGPERDGHRYAVALSDGKWSALDVVLVDIGPDGSTQADIHKLLDDAALGYVRKHVKRMSDGYACDYQISSLPELGLRTGFYDIDKVRVPFVSAVPKNNGYTGTIALQLSTTGGKPHAEAGEVRETPGEIDPATDDPHVVGADNELNIVYSDVRNKLDKAGKAKLVAEQRNWIKDRDAKVANEGLENTDKQYVNNPRIARDLLLLKLTQERSDVLKARRGF